MSKPRTITVVCNARDCGQSFIFREGIDYCEVWDGGEKYFHRECWERGYERLRRDLREEPDLREPYYE